MSKLPDNYNPIHHDCEAKGCWNKQYRPNIEYFYHALPRKLTMSDIDGVAEVNGSFLFLEWKSHKGPLPVGQRILAERLTRLSTQITYVVIQHEPGNPMGIENVMVVHAGKFSEWQECSIIDLNDRIAAWAKKVDVQVVGGREAA
ncbi:MAG: hypothetical protein M9939_00840 [Mesorhizobium sp.]|nr:hypothetical protein [Mesorhizobium sp.]MCO5159654.1 hypothetical protein [Mesorhizobium sp.]